MKIAAVIQARMNSNRLPGKVLFLAGGKPLLQLQIERVMHSKLINEIIVATTDKKEEDAIIDLCGKLSIKYFRGSELDVLDRFYQCAMHFDLEIIVRLTADDPLQEPEVMDEIINRFLQSNCDYASNTIRPTYPDGFDAEVFTFNALRKAWLEAKLYSEREHVTTFIKNHPEFFKLISIEGNQDASGLNLAVDYSEDYIFIKDIIENLNDVKPYFKYQHILEYLDKKHC